MLYNYCLWWLIVMVYCCFFVWSSDVAGVDKVQADRWNLPLSIIYWTTPSVMIMLSFPCDNQLLIIIYLLLTSWQNKILIPQRKRWSSISEDRRGQHKRRSLMARDWMLRVSFRECDDDDDKNPGRKGQSISNYSWKSIKRNRRSVLSLSRLIVPVDAAYYYLSSNPDSFKYGRLDVRSIVFVAVQKSPTNIMLSSKNRIRAKSLAFKAKKALLRSAGY